MSDPIPKNDDLAAAEKAICSLASDSWFLSLSPHWQDFMVSHTVETFHRYEVTIEQAAQKLIEFYVEITLDNPEVKTVNPFEAEFPADSGAFSEDL